MKTFIIIQCIVEKQEHNANENNITMAIKVGDWVKNSASTSKGKLKVVEVHTNRTWDCVQEDGPHAMCESYNKDGSLKGCGDIPLNQLVKIK